MLDSALRYLEKLRIRLPAAINGPLYTWKNMELALAVVGHALAHAKHLKSSFKQLETTVTRPPKKTRPINLLPKLKASTVTAWLSTKREPHYCGHYEFIDQTRYEHERDDERNGLAGRA